VQDYATEFRSLLLEIPGMQEEEKIDRFIRGLKDNIRMEVELREPADLNEAIKIADRYDSIAFRYQKKVSEPIKKVRSSQQELRPIPMELDSR